MCVAFYLLMSQKEGNIQFKEETFHNPQDLSSRQLNGTAERGKSEAT